jgi:gamma-tubulin complex component 2
MSRFYKRIEDAYIHANKTLLKLMIDEQELIPHLRWVLANPWPSFS